MKTLIYLLFSQLLYIQCLSQPSISREESIRLGDECVHRGKYLDAFYHYGRAKVKFHSQQLRGEMPSVEEKEAEMFKIIESKIQKHRSNLDSMLIIQASLAQEMETHKNQLAQLKTQCNNLAALNSRHKETIDSLKAKLLESHKHVANLSNALRFYENGIAVGRTADGKFNYVNRKGIPVDNYTYLQASPFTYPGFAQALQSGAWSFVLNKEMKRFPAATNPEQIKNSGIQAIDFRNQKLVNLPVEVTALIGLEIILLSGNELTSFPASFHFPKSIKVLDISNNRFVFFPYKEIGEMTALQHLYIGNNPFLLGSNKEIEFYDWVKNHLPNCTVHF